MTARTSGGKRPQSPGETGDTDGGGPISDGDGKRGDSKTGDGKGDHRDDDGGHNAVRGDVKDAVPPQQRLAPGSGGLAALLAQNRNKFAKGEAPQAISPQAPSRRLTPAGNAFESLDVTAVGGAIGAGSARAKAGGPLDKAVDKTDDKAADKTDGGVNGSPPGALSRTADDSGRLEALLARAEAATEAIDDELTNKFERNAVVLEEGRGGDSDSFEGLEVTAVKGAAGAVKATAPAVSHAAAKGVDRAEDADKDAESDIKVNGQVVAALIDTTLPVGDTTARSGEVTAPARGVTAPISETTAPVAATDLSKAAPRPTRPTPGGNDRLAALLAQARSRSGSAKHDILGERGVMPAAAQPGGQSAGAPAGGQTAAAPSGGQTDASPSSAGAATAQADPRLPSPGRTPAPLAVASLAAEKVPAFAETLMGVPAFAVQLPGPEGTTNWQSAPDDDTADQTIRNFIGSEPMAAGYEGDLTDRNLPTPLGARAPVGAAGRLIEELATGSEGGGRVAGRATRRRGPRLVVIAAAAVGALTIAVTVNHYRKRTADPSAAPSGVTTIPLEPSPREAAAVGFPAPPGPSTVAAPEPQIAPPPPPGAAPAAEAVVPQVIAIPPAAEPANVPREDVADPKPKAAAVAAPTTRPPPPPVNVKVESRGARRGAASPESPRQVARVTAKRQRPRSSQPRAGRTESPTDLPVPEWSKAKPGAAVRPVVDSDPDATLPMTGR